MKCKTKTSTRTVQTAAVVQEFEPVLRRIAKWQRATPEAMLNLIFRTVTRAFIEQGPGSGSTRMSGPGRP